MTKSIFGFNEDSQISKMGLDEALDNLYARDYDLNAIYSETAEEGYFDFTVCQRKDGSYYGTGGQCRKGVETDHKTDDKLVERLKARGMAENDAFRAAVAIKKLMAEQAGGLKESGANLQSPEQAAKYAGFYEKGLDKTHKAPFNTDPKVAEDVLNQMKVDYPKDYARVKGVLDGKGSPTAEQRAEAGWTGDNRAKAVLKSLMDNDFKDVQGQDLSWRQGLQLDHRRAGSTGGKDTPDNWIWISTATNQTKGGLEAAAKKRGGTPQEKEAYIQQGLIAKLKANAKMSAEDVSKAKSTGAAKDQAKVELQRAMRDNLPMMNPKRRQELIETSSAADLKAMVKGSAGVGINPATNRKIATRPVLSGGGGARVRKDYGTAPQMRALLKARWGHALSDGDLQNIGGILKASTGSKKDSKERLNELLGNWKPDKPLSNKQRETILKAAE